jgi:hypothetical protein
VRSRIALFTKDTAGWRTVELDLGGENDLDADLIWAMNRMARIVGAEAAAFVGERNLDGKTVSCACVMVERRGAAMLEVHRLGRGEGDETAHEAGAFEIVPGGSDEGWGRTQDHDGLEQRFHDFPWKPRLVRTARN